MISWIQTYFQRHFKVVFAVLLAVVIVAFVFTIGASPGIGTAERRFIEREFFGYKLNQAEDSQRLFGDAQASLSLQYGAFSGMEAEQVQNYALHRAAALHLADRWHIPAATTEEVTAAIKNLRMFMGQDGQFDPKAYSTFRDNLKTNSGGLSERDIARVIADDIRMNKVNQLLAGPGYVTPADIKQQLIRADTTWTLSTASTNYASFQPDIKPSEEELTKFFEENAFRYEIPPRVVASHVLFPASQFLPQVTVTESEVRAFYDANPARFPKPAAAESATPNVTPAADPAADFAAVRPQVEATLKQERAQRLATKAASDLAVAIFDRKVANGTPLDKFLAERQLTPQPLAPFTREAGPAELGGSREVANEAFRLGKDRFVSDAVSTPAGAVVLFWKETLPAQKPLFTQVRDRVASDYIESEKRKRFVEQGRKIKEQIEARLKAGENFEKAVASAAASSGLQFETKSLPPFSLRSPPQDIDYSILNPLERIEQGQVSEMVITADKGIFVYAAEKKLPDTSETNPRFAEMRTQLSSFVSRMGSQAYLSDLVEKELKRTEPKAE